MKYEKSNNSFILNFIKKYFKFDTYNAIIKKEVIGGISTFLAMAYILAVNPSMVSSANGAGKNLIGGLFLSTALSSFFATFLMGIYARVPISLAPGMGLNAFFTYTVASQIGFESALSITLLSGILYFFIVLTPAREKISKVMPTNLKLSIGAGIGFFVAYIGLQDAKIIVKEQAPELVSKLGDFSHPMVIISLVLLLLALVLHYSKVPGAIIITMLVGAIILIPLIATKAIKDIDPSTINPIEVGYKGFNTLGDVVSSAWKGFLNSKMWTSPITYVSILSFLYMDFFDTTGTLISIDKTLDLSKNDKKWIAKANVVDAFGTITGASIGSTTVTAFVESTVGISAGAKTGLAAIVTSLLFGLSIALWPIMQIFMPLGEQGFKPITSPILILVGTMMISQIKHFEWEIFIDIPTLFMTILFMTLSNSIAYGIAFGTLTFVVLNGSLGIIQNIFRKNNKRIVNSFEMINTNHDGPEVKVREFYYLKRINKTLLIISLISIAYIVVQTGISYHNWFS